MIPTARGGSAFNRAVIGISLLAIIAGIGLRLYSLNVPLFWPDEVASAIRATGHLGAQYGALYDGRIRPVSDLRALVSLNGTGPGVIPSILHDEPQRSPLFFLLERGWINLFGTSATGYRGLSVALGIATIALAFCFGRFVGRANIAGLVTASLFSLSPMFVVYARQAREYTLFADATILATWALIAVSRRMSSRLWIIYGATLTIGLYCDPLFAIVIVAHALAIALGPENSLGRMRSLTTWVGVAAAATVLYAPWAYVAAHSNSVVSGQLGWGKTYYPLKFQLQKWAFNYGALAFDAEYRSLALAPVAAICIVLISIGAVIAARRSDRIVRTSLLALVIVNAAAFEALDLVERAHFATETRYMFGTWVGLELLCGLGVSFALTSQRYRNIAFVAWAIVLGCGGYAAVLRGASENWWEQGRQLAYETIARRINEVTRPVIFAENTKEFEPLVLSRYVRDDAQFALFYRTSTVPRLPVGRNIFLFLPSTTVLARIKKAAGNDYAILNESPSESSALVAFQKTLHNELSATTRNAVPASEADDSLFVLVRRHKN